MILSQAPGSCEALIQFLQAIEKARKDTRQALEAIYFHQNLIE